jgi:hypothetical protein
MSCALSSLFLIVGGVSLGISIWEAVTAANHDPKHNDYTSDMIQGYAFCITKCVLNMITAITFLLCGFLFCFVNGSVEEGKKDNNNNSSILQIISLGVSIWGLIMYFNDYKTGPFQNIIFAETIIFFISLGIFAFVLFGICCVGVCGVCITSIDNNETTIYSNIRKIQIPETKQPIVTTNETNNDNKV